MRLGLMRNKICPKHLKKYKKCGCLYALEGYVVDGKGGYIEIKLKQHEIPPQANH